MPAGATIQHKRKAGAFTGGDLAAGELGVDTGTGDLWLSTDGSTTRALTSTDGSAADPLTCHELRILGPSYYAWIGAVLRWGESGLIIEPPSSMSAGVVTLNMMSLELYGAAYFYGGPVSFFSAGAGIEGPLDISASASTSSKLDLLLTYLASAGLVHMTP